MRCDTCFGGVDRSKFWLWRCAGRDPSGTSVCSLRLLSLCTAWSEDAAFCLPGNAPCVLDSAGSKGTSGVSEDEALQRPFCALGDGVRSRRDI